MVDLRHRDAVRRLLVLFGGQLADLLLGLSDTLLGTGNGDELALVALAGDVDARGSDALELAQPLATLAEDDAVVLSGNGHLPTGLRRETHQDFTASVEQLALLALDQEGKRLVLAAHNFDLGSRLLGDLLANPLRFALSELLRLRGLTLLAGDMQNLLKKIG